MVSIYASLIRREKHLVNEEGNLRRFIPGLFIWECKKPNPMSMENVLDASINWNFQSHEQWLVLESKCPA